MEKPEHYNNKNGSLYQFCQNQELNSYEFDILKRVIRCRKKGKFKEDLEKTKFLIDLYLKEEKDNYSFPFSEGDDYWVIEVGQIIWSCWDEESEEMHDENPDRTYYTTKQQAINAYNKQIINNNGINN